MYNYNKRQKLRNWIRETSTLITYMKDDRKMDHNRKYPDWIQPEDLKTPNGTEIGWIYNGKRYASLAKVSYEFRHYHIVASMMRGKTIDQIETLPQSKEKLEAREKPNMRYVKQLLQEYECDEESENVCIDMEQIEQESTSSTGGSCSSTVLSTNPVESMEKPNTGLFEGIRRTIAQLF